MHVIVGLGQTGLALARGLTYLGLPWCVWDTREAPPGLESFRETYPEARIWCGPNPDFGEVKIRQAWLSPGVSAEQGVVFDKLTSLNIPFAGEVALWAELLKESPRATVVAVTGTNGKTTTVNLLSRLFEAAGHRVALAGNVGKNLVDAWLEAKASNTWPTAWIVELSSFQCATQGAWSPDVGVVLNVTEDHLDWHRSMETYTQSKWHLCENTKVAVLNVDMKDAFLKWVDTKATPEHLYTVGWDKTSGADSFIEGDMLVTPCWQMPTSTLGLVGLANHFNTLAALSVLMGLGMPMTPAMLDVLHHYTGERHRMERVGVGRGFTFIDDSKGTNVGATVMAIDSARRLGDVGIILGGDAKGQNIDALQASLKHVTFATTMGQDKEAFERVLTRLNIPHQRVHHLTEAIDTITRHMTGGVVLLSPACASWDMFKNYHDRGEQFKVAAQAWLEGINADALH